MRQASHVDFVHERDVICSFGGGGFPGLAAVTFLCKTSWKNSIVFFASLNISKSSLQNIKNEQLDRKTSLYPFIIPSLRRIRIIPSRRFIMPLNHSRPTSNGSCAAGIRLPKVIQLSRRSVKSRKCFLKTTMYNYR